MATALHVQCRNATLIAGDVQGTSRQQQTTVDVDHAIEFRTALRDRNTSFPHRHAVGDVQRHDFTGRQAGQRQAIGHDRRTGATQGQYGRSAVIQPALVAGGRIQADQAIVLGLNHHHVTVVRRRRQHFAGHTSAPLFFAVDGVQSDHFALEGADHYQTVTHADGAGNRQFKILFPLDVTVAAIHRHDHAADIAGIDGVAVDRRHQHVVGFALTVTDRTAPLLLQDHFFLEVDQLCRWQFFFAVAAATRGQNGQSQQCCMFPTDHVTHPLWPGRPV
ncbi:hypothetical protein D3C78_991200 [compost metagenome]